MGVASASDLTGVEALEAVETLRRGVGTGGSFGSLFLCERGFDVPPRLDVATGAGRTVGIGWEGPDMEESAS